MDLSSLSNKLLPGLTTLGFKDDRRHKGTSFFVNFNHAGYSSHLIIY